MPAPIPPAIAELINKSQNILVIAPRYPSPDAFCAALALYGYLRQQQKAAQVVAEAADIGEQFGFTRFAEALQSSGGNGDKEFVIQVNLAKTKVKEFRYDVVGDTMRIFLTPEQGMFAPADVSATESKLPYDCVIAIGASALDRLGNIFARHREFFYATPVINIDNQSHNENYGRVNHIVVAAPTLSEIVAGLLWSMEAAPLPEAVSTNLLGGIIAATQIFRAPGMTPQTFQAAARLMEQGGRHDQIMQRLNQTKTVEMLRLWGEALTRTHATADGRLLVAQLPREVMQKNASIVERQQLHQLVDELLIHAPHTLVIALLYEPASSQTTELLLRTKKHIDPHDIFPAITFTQKQSCFHHSFAQTIAEVEKTLEAAVGGYMQKA